MVKKQPNHEENEKNLDEIVVTLAENNNIESNTKSYQWFKTLLKVQEQKINDNSSDDLAENQENSLYDEGRILH